MIEVYGLFDIRDGVIRYVGISKDAQRRFLQHVFGGGGSPALREWKEKRPVGMYVLQETSEKWREEYWIQGLRLMGNDLLNSARSLDGMDELKRRGLIGKGLTADEEVMVRVMEIVFLTKGKWYPEWLKPVPIGLLSSELYSLLMDGGLSAVPGWIKVPAARGYMGETVEGEVGDMDGWRYQFRRILRDVPSVPIV
jgi:hypothetical protein